MANLKDITELTNKTTLAGTEKVLINDGGTLKTAPTTAFGSSSSSSSSSGYDFVIDFTSTESSPNSTSDFTMTMDTDYTFAELAAKYDDINGVCKYAFTYQGLTYDIVYRIAAGFYMSTGASSVLSSVGISDATDTSKMMYFDFITDSGRFDYVHFSVIVYCGTNGAAVPFLANVEES